MPRSTLGQPDDRQPTPPKQAVFGECFDGVLTTGRHEAARRWAQRRHHVPVELNHEYQPAHNGSARTGHPRASRRRHAQRLDPARSRTRRNPRRNSCSSRADDASRLPGSARITIRSVCSRSVSMPRTTCRRRRETRCRSTADPTDLATISPTRGPGSVSSAVSRCIWTTRSGCAARIPYFTVASNSRDRRMRLRAGSTANKPVGQIRQRARDDPCGDGQRRWRARPWSASAGESHARGRGAGCSAGRSVCPWPRRSPRSVSLEAFPALRPLTFGSARLLRVGRNVVLLLAGAVPGERNSWVAAVSPTFGRLYEGTDADSLGQTWPVPTRRAPDPAPILLHSRSDAQAGGTSADCRQRT